MQLLLRKLLCLSTRLVNLQAESVCQDLVLSINHDNAGITEVGRCSTQNW